MNRCLFVSTTLAYRGSVILDRRLFSIRETLKKIDNNLKSEQLYLEDLLLTHQLDIRELKENPK